MASVLLLTTVNVMTDTRAMLVRSTAAHLVVSQDMASVLDQTIASVCQDGKENPVKNVCNHTFKMYIYNDQIKCNALCFSLYT